MIIQNQVSFSHLSPPKYVINSLRMKCRQISHCRIQFTDHYPLLLLLAPQILIHNILSVLEYLDSDLDLFRIFAGIFYKGNLIFFLHHFHDHRNHLSCDLLYDVFFCILIFLSLLHLTTQQKHLKLSYLHKMLPP